jgi:putative oxidoreductase
MNCVQRLILFLGRACLSAIFICAALWKVIDWQGTEVYLTNALSEWRLQVQANPWLHDYVESLLTWVPLLLTVAFVFELLGGVMLFFGIKVRFAAILLILFLIPTTLIFHSFWVVQGNDRSLQMIMFLKNLSILGGLLIALAVGKGCREKERSGDLSPSKE